MDFSAINYLSVLLAAIAAFIFGAGYYGVLSKAWMKAGRIDAVQARPGAAILGVTFGAELVMAFVLAGIVGAGEVTLEAASSPAFSSGSASWSPSWRSTTATRPMAGT
ncbi:MAG: DUF1761 family protein [Aliihoeflea sp.]|uniref:DUF1761 family protein n=1 Tax=Aliihoeflea sp. TaxID=2608088 RepID=UPI004034D2F6